MPSFYVWEHIDQTPHCSIEQLLICLTVAILGQVLRAVNISKARTLLFVDNSSFVMGDFKDFILQVDEVAPDGEVVNTVIDVLAENGIAS